MKPVDCFAFTGRHYIDHIAPVWHALPDAARGLFLTSYALAPYAKSLGIDARAVSGTDVRRHLTGRGGLVLVASHSDPQITDRCGRKNAILMHGVGFNFDDAKSLPNYPGTTKRRSNTVLMLSTNESIAEIERAANPGLRVEVVGCPRLDKWHTKPAMEKHDPPTIAVAWHWRCNVAPEAGTAFDHFRDALPALAERYKVIGHGHPRIIDELEPIYKSMGIEVVKSADEVFRRADLLVADATSLQYEWATLDRPQVVCNSPRYRRDVDFGLRFWKHADVGVQCDEPDDLLGAVELALKDTPEQQEARHAAADYAYTYRDGKCAERASVAIMVALESCPEGSIDTEDMGRIHKTMNRARAATGHRGRMSREERLAKLAKIVGVATPRVSTRDDEKWLTLWGWKIPKGDVKIPDPHEWPSVGIVIPAYNAPALLERCLSTLLTTQYPGELAVQIVDNASTDAKTLHLIKQYAGATSIRFDSPVGFSEAVNAGMRAVEKLSPVDYYVLHNQDVAVTDPDWLKHLIRWMEYKPECAIAGPKLLYDNGTIENAGIDMGNNDGCAERGRGAAANDPRYNDYRKVATVSGAVYCLRKSVTDRMGLFDERYLFGCEDLEYGMRVSATLGMECWYVPDSVLIHSSHGVQRKSSAADRLRVQAMHAVSAEIYNSEWGTYREHVAGSKVAFVLPNFHSACGGARVVGALARQLSICGVQAEVFVRKMETDPDVNYPGFSVRPIRELVEADVVIATRCDTLADAKRCKAKRRIYFVQQIEDCMSENFGVPRKAALASYKDEGFEILTIGQHLADRLKEMGRESTIVDVGLYRDLYPLALRKKPCSPFRVLMYGCDGYKGPDQAAIADAIRAAAPGVEVNTFHRYAATPKYSDNHFRPETTAEVAALYGSHDCYVYASESDGFAMTPVEAMATGTPVVITDFPGKDQYARDGKNCLIAPFRDSRGVAERVAKLASDPKLWRRLSKAGPLTADRYDWGVLTAQYAKFLLEAPL